MKKHTHKQSRPCFIETRNQTNLSQMQIMLNFVSKNYNETKLKNQKKKSEFYCTLRLL
jgi:hypothetical protein